MVKEHINTTYECEVCGREYDCKKDAIKCEGQPVKPFKYKIGNRIRVTHEEYSSLVGKILRREIASGTHENSYLLKIDGEIGLRGFDEVDLAIEWFFYKSIVFLFSHKAGLPSR